MQPIRKVQMATHFRWVEAPSRTDPTKTSRYLTPCSPGAAGAQEMTWIDIEPDQLLEPELTVQDFLKAVQSSRPTVNKDDIMQQVNFTNDFGRWIFGYRWTLDIKIQSLLRPRRLEYIGCLMAIIQPNYQLLRPNAHQLSVLIS